MLVAVAEHDKLTVLPVGHAVHYLHRLDAHGTYTLQQVYDSILVVGEPVRVELLADGRVAGLAFLVLVEYPLQRRTASELIAPCVGGDSGEGGLVVEDDYAALLVGA